MLTAEAGSAPISDAIQSLCPSASQPTTGVPSTR